MAESGCDLYAAYHMLEKNERGQFDIKGLIYLKSWMIKTELWSITYSTANTHGLVTN